MASALSAVKKAAIGFGRSRVMSHPSKVRKTGALAPSISWTHSKADRDNSFPDFSIQMKRPAQILAFQNASEPVDLVRGLEKRVIAVNDCVLPLNDILDFADRFTGDIPDSLDMLRNE